MSCLTVREATRFRLTDGLSAAVAATFANKRRRLRRRCMQGSSVEKRGDVVFSLRCHVLLCRHLRGEPSLPPLPLMEPLSSEKPLLGEALAITVAVEQCNTLPYRVLCLSHNSEMARYYDL
ncbi:uncharacterized protein DS421_10g300180 [Arachis hypogaea]|nr:uncharacterized protein DS421_10g300180 [Arachis hypogaea]